MDQHEWLTSQNPHTMMDWLVGPHSSRHPLATDRRLRLFCVASYQATWRRRLEQSSPWFHWQEGKKDDLDRFNTYNVLVRNALASVRRPPDGLEILHADLVRAAFGNPWKPVVIDPAWLTQQVIELATLAWQERPGRHCGDCKGMGRCSGDGLAEWVPNRSYQCPACKGTGHLDDGSLDPLTLAALADALEEAGCPGEQKCHDCNGRGETDHKNYHGAWDTYGCGSCNSIGRLPCFLLTNLREPTPRYRGFWPLEEILTHASLPPLDLQGTSTAP